MDEVNSQEVNIPRFGEQRKKMAKTDDDSDRQSYRVNCGAEIIIPNVLLYLGSSGSESKEVDDSQSEYESEEVDDSQSEFESEEVDDSQSESESEEVDDSQSEEGDY